MITIAVVIVGRAITLLGPIQKISKEIKSNNFCCRKVIRAITKWGATVKSPILLSQN